MTRSPSGRLSLGAASIAVGALLAGMLLYLVPTLALAGSLALAIAIAVVGVGGIGALLVLHGGELRARDRLLDRERSAAALHGRVLDHAAEAFLVVNEAGRLSYASANLARVVDGDVDRFDDIAGLLDLLRPVDRRRVVHEFAKVRREPGASFTVEVTALGPGGREKHLALRAVDLADEPSVRGLLVGLRDITPRKAFETEYRQLAYYDPLTGLANRQFFFEQGARMLALARRRGHAISLLYLDLDRFKQVNDLLGHEAGDELLRRVAEGLRRSLRDTDIAARIGGDEFGVILAEVRDVEAAGRVAHRVLGNMPAAAISRGHEVPVSASLGVAMFPEDGEQLEPLLQAADLAMYRAKTEALGVQFYRPELRDHMADRMRLEQDMRRALEQHEFQLHYQPIFSVETGAVVGAEALCRWRHFTRGMVATAEFIELAETSGLIRSLDRWAIARAVHQRSVALDDGFTGWIAVNLSPHSMADRDLPGFVQSVLEQYDVAPGGLVLDLPDSAVGADPDAAGDLMWKLKNAGASIAVDDYGVGRASLAELRTLPIDILKLDPELTRRVGRGEADERLVEGAMAIARGIRAKVLAKGVERPEQVEWLRSAGCDYVQGYLVGPPVPAEELATPVPREEAEPGV
jgi:diguanylate cyclase (GGDEF)-like protein